MSQHAPQNMSNTPCILFRVSPLFPTHLQVWLFRTLPDSTPGNTKTQGGIGLPFFSYICSYTLKLPDEWRDPSSSWELNCVYSTPKIGRGGGIASTDGCARPIRLLSHNSFLLLCKEVGQEPLGKSFPSNISCSIQLDATYAQTIYQEQALKKAQS